MWGLVCDFETRAKWDDRMVDFERLEHFVEDNCSIITMRFPKPPIPVVAQREVVIKGFRCENYFGENDHLTLGTSVDHPARPIGEGYFDYVRALGHIGAFRVCANPDGPGVLLAEVRHVDVQGAMPELVINQVAEWAPTINYSGWDKKYKAMTS